MKLNELRAKLNELDVRPDAYSLTGSSYDECYVISNDEPEKWSVYYRERGLRTSCKTFSSEDEACKDLLETLKNDPTVRTK